VSATPQVRGAGDDGKGPRGWVGILLGLVLTAVLHVAAIALLVATLHDPGGYQGLMLMLGIGLVQLPYMVPAIVVARLSRRMALAKGLAIGAAVTFLLNATCWMFVLAK
jgi:hypothetical protein